MRKNILGCGFFCNGNLSVLDWFARNMFKNKETGEEKELSKSWAALIVLLNIIPVTLAWAALRFIWLRSNDFVCKYCHKEFSIGFETEKGVCKPCYKKKHGKESL